MANITISGLTGKTAVATDEIEVQATGGGASNKVTLASAFAANNGATLGANTFTALQQYNVADVTVAVSFGGTTSSFPALRRNGTTLEAVRADASTFATFKADIFNASTRHTNGNAGLQESSVSTYWAMMTSTASAYAGAYANQIRLTATGALTSTVALGYGSSGVAEINSTVAGTYRDLTLRDINANHVIGRGTAPTVTGNGSSNGSIAGSDTGAKITVGTGTTTSIVMTFGTAYANAPVCVVNAQTTTTPINVVTTTTTATLTTAAFTAGEVLHVVCVGF